MLKYVNTGIVFQEIPDEVTLAINISNCPCHCPGCHSHYLWDDIGLPLDTDAIDAFIENVGKEYTEKTGLTAEFYVVEIGDGPYAL